EASWLWLLAYFVVITVGELYLSPIGLSLVSKVAPARMVSMLMGLWLATSFTGNFIAGWLGSFWSGMDKATFFLMIAGIALLAGAVILAFDRPLRKVVSDQVPTSSVQLAARRASSLMWRLGSSTSITRFIRITLTCGSRLTSGFAITSRLTSRSRRRRLSACRKITTSA